MRENKYLYASYGSLVKGLCWCLFATSIPFSVFAADVVVDGFSYDSSLQRSSFLSINPNYEKILEASVADRRSHFFWKLRFDAQSLETDDNINSQIAGATFRAKFGYKLIESVEFKAKSNLSLESGRTQDIFGDQEPGSGIYPREVKITYTPFKDVVEIDAGMIHQRFFNMPIFIGNLGFIGLSEKVFYESERFDVGVRLQQLIPTSYTNSTRVGERENVPYFYTESLEATWRTSRWNFLKTRLSHFRYENLPSVVAFDSFIFGNTVTNTDVNNARFIYDFDGWVSQWAFEQKFSDSLAAQLQWQIVKNTAAPSDAGEGRMISIGVANDFGRWIAAVKFVDFFIESDAVPARYNSHAYGHNNRIGNALNFSLESKDWGVNFKADYVKADLLNQSIRRLDGLQQDNQQTIYFAVETMYEFI